MIIPETETLAYYEPDFGGLALPLDDGSFAFADTREIPLNDTVVYAKERLAQLLHIDDPDMQERLPYTEELDNPVECQRTSWARRIHPVCNSIHELTTLQEPPPPPPALSYDDRQATRTVMVTTTTTTIDYLSHGYFRDTWLYQPNPSARGPSNNNAFCLKTLRMMQTFDYDTMNLIEVEAIIMERLTGSPRIVDIYGHCGTSLAAEYMAHEITQTIVPGTTVFSSDRGMIAQSKLDQLQETDVHPMNNLTLTAKLELAVTMAESLADIHGFSGGAIVHGDVHPDQWLRPSSFSSQPLKLNDFSNGMIMEWSAANQTYCDFWTWYGGTYKAPEELRGAFVGAPADVWAMGNGIYGLLTGLYPYYDSTDQDATVEEILQQDRKPFVDDRYRNRSLVEGRLVEIMEQCWALQQKDRVDIFGVVAHLYETVRLLHQQETS